MTSECIRSNCTVYIVQYIANVSNGCQYFRRRSSKDICFSYLCPCRSRRQRLGVCNSILRLKAGQPSATLPLFLPAGLQVPSYLCRKLTHVFRPHSLCFWRWWRWKSLIISASYWPISPGFRRLRRFWTRIKIFCRYLVCLINILMPRTKIWSLQAGEQRRQGRWR